MKKCSMLLWLSVFALVGCGYTEEERQMFYKSCMQEKLSSAFSFLDEMVVSCACENWSLRKDIKPKSETARFDQYIEEREKCYSAPIKNNPKYREYFVSKCKQAFTKTSASDAQIYAKTFAMTGMPQYAVAEQVYYWGMGRGSDFYKPKSNKELVGCACGRLSAHDNFTIPRTFETFEQEYKKELKECIKVWN